MAKGRGLEAPVGCGFRMRNAVWILAAIAVISSGSAPADAQWRRLELGNGGAVSEVFHDPSGAVFAGTLRGAYRSTDGGQSWQRVLSGAPVEYLLRSGSGVLAGSTAGLFHSSDGGTSWSSSPVHPSGPPDVRSLAVDPSDPQIVLLSAFYWAEPLYAFQSSDGGRSFVDASGDLTEPVGQVAINSDGSAWYAAADSFGNLYMSSDRGTTWTLHASVPASEILVIRADPSNPLILHVGTADAGVHRSTDGGASFSPVNSGLPANARIEDIHITADGRYLLAAHEAGVFTSSDGLSWTAASSLAPERARAVSSNPNTADHVLVGSDADSSFPVGLHRSANFGASWQPSNTGLEPAIAVNDLAVSPLDPERLLLTAPTVALASPNRGDSWSPGSLQDGMRAAGSRLEAARFFAITNAADVVHRSDDGGLSWSPSSSGLSSIQAASLAISAADPQIAWLGSNAPAPAVYKSTDEGASWTATGAGIPPSCFPVLVRAGYADPLLAYAGCGFDGLYRSTDGGGSWHPTAHVSPVSDVAVDGTDGTLYLAGGGRLWASTDGGDSFSDISGSLSCISEVEVAAAGAVIYVVDSCLFSVRASTDEGASWHLVSDSPTPSLMSFGLESLKADPSVPGRLYLLSPSVDQLFLNDAFTIDWDPSLAGTADLQLSKTVSPSSAEPGDTATFTLVVMNAGPAVATFSQVIDQLPQGFRWVSDDCGAGPPVGNQLIWSVGDLAPLASATCNVVGEVGLSAAGTITNRASATSGVVDPTPEDATASASIRAPAAPAVPDLSTAGMLLMVSLIGLAGFLARRS